MARDRLNRVLLLALSGSCYGLVALCTWVVEKPELGIATFYLVPTCLLASTLGPRGGLAGALLSTLIYALVRLHHLDVGAPTLALAAVVRGCAFLSGGLLVGWFAERNRGLVAELRSVAARDFLTGLGNARAFQEAIQARCADLRPFALLIGDADALKLVNDQHGHAAGDLALKQVAATLRAELRPDDDELARIGGDEFSILTTVASGDEAQAIVARLERRLLDTECPVTFGWAVFPYDAANQVGLFAIADRRLYERKPPAEARMRPVAQLRVAAADAAH